MPKNSNFSLLLSKRESWFASNQIKLHLGYKSGFSVTKPAF